MTYFLSVPVESSSKAEMEGASVEAEARMVEMTGGRR